MTINDERNREKLEADAKRLGLTPTALEMSRAVGTDLIGDIVRDNRRSMHERSGILPPQPAAPAKPPVGQGGWIEPPQVRDWKPPGLAVMDRMMDAQDARDLAERKRGR